MMNATMEKTLSIQARDWREGRRLRAFELKERGWKQTEIADALGVTEGAVSQWMKRATEEGVEGLKHKPPPGATPRLSEENAPNWLSFWPIMMRKLIAFGEGVDVRAGSRADPQGVRGQIPPGACESAGEGFRTLVAEACPPGRSARRGSYRTLERGSLARVEKGL